MSKLHSPVNNAPAIYSRIELATIQAVISSVIVHEICT